MKAIITRYPLASYFFLAFFLTWSIEVPILLAERGLIDFHLPMAMEAVAAFGPFGAACIVLAAMQMPVKDLLTGLLHWKVPPLWALVTIGLPFVVMLLALAQTGQLSNLFSGAICGAISAEGRWFEILVIGALIRGIGEEPGWRGFALPLLRGRYGPLLATLILWPFWAVWHLPAYLARPDPSLFVFTLFSLGILAATFWSTLLYDKTRSILMLALWHALINVTRAFTQTSSADAFMAYNQVTILLGVVIAAYWLIARPGPYKEDLFARKGLQSPA
ncbi:MAG: CPBP family intramembrane glutamic endopeptidase [Gammaproteobacteria bacterium]